MANGECQVVWMGVFPYIIYVISQDASFAHAFSIPLRPVSLNETCPKWLIGNQPLEVSMAPVSAGTSWWEYLKIRMLFEGYENEDSFITYDFDLNS